MVNLDTLLVRVQRIHDLTQPERKPEDGDGETKWDEFSKKKKEISAKIKAIRSDLKAREEVMDKDNKRAAEMSQAIRAQIKAVREDANALQAIQRKEAKKYRKATGDKADIVRTRAEIVDLVFQHIAECENWERRRATERAQDERADLMAGSSSRPTRGMDTYEMRGLAGGADQSRNPFESELPDFEDIGDDLQQIREREADIEADLEQISSGVSKLKHIALEMNEELALQNQMIDAVQSKVENTGAKLETLNQKMSKTLNGVMKGDRFLINFVLIAILLAIIGFVASMFT